MDSIFNFINCETPCPIILLFFQDSEVLLK